MYSIFTHGRINVDFSPADAVSITPGLKLADVLSGLGKPYQTALATAAPVPIPRSYCELTSEACANPALAYETLFPIPSTHCGGCQAWSRPWPAADSKIIGNDPRTWGPPLTPAAPAPAPLRPGENGGGVQKLRPGQNGGGVQKLRPGQNGGGVRNMAPAAKKSLLAATTTPSGTYGQVPYDVALSQCADSSNPATCFKNICGPTGASCYQGSGTSSTSQQYVPADAYQVDLRDMIPGQFLKTEYQKTLY
jgi:hypothetical protein